MTSEQTVDSVQKIHEWQKRISPKKYEPSRITPNLTRDQQALVEAVSESARLLVDVVLQQTGIDHAVLDRLPPIAAPLTSAQFANRDWQGDQCIHRAVAEWTGTRAQTAEWTGTRAQTMDYEWWHLFMLRQLRDSLLPDPPLFLLNTMNPPFQKDILDGDLHDTEASTKDQKDAHYRLDLAVRTYLRRVGGIWHRPAYSILNSPMRQGWWMVDLAKRAAELGLVEAVDVYEALDAAWSNWAKLAAHSTTRLAHPNCVAAYVLAAQDHKNACGEWPKGSEAKTITEKLMRRTLHVSVPLVDPKVLAKLAA